MFVHVVVQPTDALPVLRETLGSDAHSSSVGAFLVGSLVAIVGLFVLFSTDVGQQAWLDQQVKGAEGEAAQASVPPLAEDRGSRITSGILRSVRSW